ncbi:MAG TPA: hypothetical protein VE978_00025 [Chitinophagales bacterium]|nr:hypothetical protein [Chitinophagales bacterium]
MKTSETKARWVTGMVTFCVFLIVSSFAFANGPKTPSAISAKYQTENADIKKDISNINLHKETIKTLEENIKADKEQGLRVAAIMHKRELMKAKADLKRDLTYLKADKMDLVNDHKLAICDSKHAVKNDQAALRTSKAKLREDIAKGDKWAIKNDANTIVDQQEQLKKDQENLDGEQENLNSDLVAINTQLGKPRITLFRSDNSETAYVQVETNR